jgi:SPP1 family predicted phage head-tail adaptor
MKLPILAPRLRHRVSIQFLEIQQSSENGTLSEEWADLMTDEPAEIVPLSGREFMAAESKQAGVTHRVTIRLSEAVMPAMRVLHDGLAYNIKAVLPDPTLRRYLTLMCESGVNDGN